MTAAKARVPAIRARIDKACAEGRPVELTYDEVTDVVDVALARSREITDATIAKARELTRRIDDLAGNSKPPAEGVPA